MTPNPLSPERIAELRKWHSYEWGLDACLEVLNAYEALRRESEGAWDRDGRTVGLFDTLKLAQARIAELEQELQRARESFPDLISREAEAQARADKAEAELNRLKYGEI